MAVGKATPPLTAEGQIDYEQLYYTAVLILGGLPSRSDIPYMDRFDQLWANQFGFSRKSTLAEWQDFRRWAERQEELS